MVKGWGAIAALDCDLHDQRNFSSSQVEILLLGGIVGTPRRWVLGIDYHFTGPMPIRRCLSRVPCWIIDLGFHRDGPRNQGAHPD
jgi:hypothetical protein